MQLEFDDDDRLAFVAARGQAADAGNGIDAFFNFLSDFALDNFRRGARVVGGDHHHREVDVGELVNAQALVRKQTQHHDGQHGHGGKDGVVQADAGEPHGGLSERAWLQTLPARRGCRLA